MSLCCFVWWFAICIARVAEASLAVEKNKHTETFSDSHHGNKLKCCMYFSKSLCSLVVYSSRGHGFLMNNLSWILNCYLCRCLILIRIKTIFLHILRNLYLYKTLSRYKVCSKGDLNDIKHSLTVKLITS